MLFTAIKRFPAETDQLLRRVILGCLLAAGMVLFLDLGAKLRAYQFFLQWRPTSLMFWGSWIFAVSVIAAALRLRVTGAVLGLGLMFYPGLLLASMAARAAWRGPWLPIQFIALSLVSGAAALMLADPRMRKRGAWVPAAACGILLGAFLARAAILFSQQG